MEETAPKFYESGNDKINWHYLPASNEILWFSERENWGNLYLYDLGSGKLKTQITHGPGNVTQVLYVDQPRTIYFVGVGRKRVAIPTSSTSTACILTAAVCAFSPPKTRITASPWHRTAALSSIPTPLPRSRRSQFCETGKARS